MVGWWPMDFHVGPWLARPGTNSIIRRRHTYRVTPKAMDVLVCLAKRHGEPVSKAEIFQEVWADAFVSDDALTRCIGELRRAFHETAQQPSIIETVAKRGYRIVAPVSWDSGEESQAAKPGSAGLPELGVIGREISAGPAELASLPGVRTRRWVFAGLGFGILLLILTALMYVSLRGRFFGRAPSQIRSIAVLPLLNLSGDAGQDYFADGMTEALTSNLSKLAKLRVISRTSAMTYKGSRKPLQTIASELNVDALLEGSVWRSGRRVRIVAQLIDASTDAHLWTETYERDVEDVLRLQGEVAEAIVRQIKVAVTPEETARMAFGPRLKPEAYEAYLKGMFHLGKFTREGFEQGMPYLQQAVEKDPADPFAYASLALGYSIMGHDRFPDAFARAKAAARRSLELGGPLAEAYAALGMEELYSDWDLPSAGRDLQRALELKPNFAEALRNHSWYLRLCGRPRDGLTEMRRAEELEPLVALFPADLAWQYFEEGQLDAAMAAARRSIELNPKFSEGLAVAGWVLTAQGKLDEALAEHLKAASADAAWKWPLGRTYALIGRKDDARKIAAEIQRAPGPMEQWGLGVIYAALGETDEAFRWLDAARKSRFSWMPWIADFSRRNPDLFTPLRHDRRFEDLTRTIGITVAHRLPASNGLVE
jgi:TolB-like protein/DNA-binding winged helix-turn-helix (wHTH) protein/Tfp pilus assembly protein PilF